MILTTTASVEGRAIKSYQGIVTGEAVIETWDDEEHDKERRAKACQVALDELAQAASGKGADAVVGIALDHQVFDGDGGMLLITASGTAVKLA